MKWPFADRERRKRELSEEIESHVRMAAQDRIARGESAPSALESARRELGNETLIREASADQWQWRWLEQLLQDLRYGARLLRKNSGFTAVAIATLALGIGANTAIFSLVNGVLLRPLPYAEPARLVMITSYYPKGPFVVMRDQSQTMEIAGIADNTEFNLTGSGDPVRLLGSAASAQFFTVLGAPAELGRTLRAGEDQPGSDQIVLLSHALWQQRFGSDPAILGRWIELGGIQRQVVGVMPADFRFPAPTTELWVPLHLDPRDTGDYWGSSYMALIGRLRPRATIEQARVELQFLRPRVLAAFPWRMADNQWKNASVSSMQEMLVGDVRAKLLILLGAVGLLLLIACANVANLLMARAAMRQREVAVRTALGAGRWRIMRQLITESALLSMCGGAAGLGLAVYGLHILKAALPADTPRLAEVTVDARVLAFTAVLAVVTGIVFGMLPARNASKLDVTETLKSGGDPNAVATRRPFSRALVVCEVAVSTVLLIGAGLLVKSLWKLSNASPGFQHERILAARITPDQLFCNVPGRCQAFYDELLSRVRALPGVQDAGAVNGLPLVGNGEAFPSDIEARPQPVGARPFMFWEKIVTTDYLRIMGIPLLKGRALTDADAGPNAEPVLLVSKSTADRNWPGQDPVGQHVKPKWESKWRTVVGVIGNVRELSVTKDAPDWIDGVMYVPYGSQSILGSGNPGPPAEMTLVIRTTVDGTEVTDGLRTVVASLNGNIPVSDVQTLKSWITEAAAGPRSTTSLFSAFAGLALALGAIGIYGVISYSVAQRRREIGIRLALGASRMAVLRLVLNQGTRLAVAGVAIGLIGATGLTRLMASLLYGVGAVDLFTYAAVAVLLLAVAIAASYIPARRAMRVDPMVALRYE